MKLKELAKPFPAEDIEWRIGRCDSNSKGIWATCLAYVSARAIMNRLDEVCGPENWTVDYRIIPASDRVEPGVIARIGIRIGDQWIYKEDGAEQTDIEPFKGGISGALKRAGSAWGIGRYLYELDSGFAEISETKQKGWNYAQTKDKKSFYWRPPELPTWALPNGPLPSVPSVKSAPAVSEEKPRTRAELIAEIMLTAQKLNCSQEELTNWVLDTFKKPTKNLTDAELAQFLDILLGELGRKGDVA